MKPYQLPELDFDYGALEPHLNGHLVELHHRKHHAGYVEGANETLEQLAQARAKDDFGKINQLQKNLAFHVSGHVLHSMFWKNLSPQGGGRPEGDLADALAESFGSFESFRAHMENAASAIQGSGWAALAWEPVGGRLLVEQVHDHQGNIGNGALPVLVLDMWEHAYYLQYENQKSRWIDAYWNIVHWADVGRRLESVRTLDLSLS